MKKNFFVILLTIETFLLLAALVLYFILFHSNQELTEVYRQSSEDGGQTIVIYEIGEPDWPFGNAHYKVCGPSDFYVDVSDDGGKGWYTVEWESDSVVITFGGSEQKNSVYELPY